MKVKNRRVLGMLLIALFLLIYMPIAATIGNYFVDKHILLNLAYFIFAGLIWVIPLKPLFNWMRAKPEEIIEGEKPPKVSDIKRRK